MATGTWFSGCILKDSLAMAVNLTEYLKNYLWIKQHLSREQNSHYQRNVHNTMEMKVAGTKEATVALLFNVINDSQLRSRKQNTFTNLMSAQK